MIAVVQRVLEGKVTVAGETVGQIGPGMVVLASVCATDSPADITWTANKLASLRIFRNGEKHFDLDVAQAGGSILLVSNFTVAAATRHGRRPSFDAAAKGEPGKALFDQLVAELRSKGINVQTGRFGADMLVSIVNDGPATFIVESRGEGQAARGE